MGGRRKSVCRLGAPPPTFLSYSLSLLEKDKLANCCSSDLAVTAPLDKSSTEGVSMCVCQGHLSTHISLVSSPGRGWRPALCLRTLTAPDSRGPTNVRALAATNCSRLTAGRPECLKFLAKVGVWGLIKWYANM